MLGQSLQVCLVCSSLQAALSLVFHFDNIHPRKKYYKQSTVNKGNIE